MLSFPLSANHSLATFSYFSSISILLGWQDSQTSFIQAQLADQVVVRELETAYRDYISHHDVSSSTNLDAVLTSVIRQLEQNLMIVTQRKDDAVNCNQNNVSFLATLISMLVSLVSSSTDVEVNYYSNLMARFDTQIKQLKELKTSLALSRPDFRSRKLLSTFVTSSPPCYNFGMKSELSNDFGGFTLRGDARIGFSIGPGGDINGDGISDFLVGAPFSESPGKSHNGKTYVVFGSNDSTAWDEDSLDSLMDGKRGFVIYGEALDDFSGSSVNSIGDINKDGCTDIVIGAVLPNAYQTGKSYVVFGSRNSTIWGSGEVQLSDLHDGKRGFVLRGDTAKDNSGFSVSSGGDINMDGISDLLIGAPGNILTSSTTATVGKAYVIFGSSNMSEWLQGSFNLSTLANGKRGFVLNGEELGDSFGVSVSTIGDMNADGISDIVIGAPGLFLANNSSVRGRVYVVFGSRDRTHWGSGSINVSSLMNGRDGFSVEDQENNYFGIVVSSAGQFSGNLSSVIIGTRVGKFYIFVGANNMTRWFPGKFNTSYFSEDRRGLAFQTETVRDELGDLVTVSSAGDINDDNYDDILIGRSRTGKTYVLYGEPTAVSWQPNTRDIGNMTKDRYGFVLSSGNGTAVTGIGDINKDGYPDFLVSDVSLGRLFVLFGKGREYFVSNYVSLRTGDVIKITPNLLNVSSYLKSNGSCVFDVTGIENGYFMLLNTSNASSSFVNISRFSMQDVNDGAVHFAHVGGAGDVPRYNLSVAFIRYGSSKASICSESEVRYFDGAPNQYLVNQSLGNGVRFHVDNLQVCYSASVCNSLKGHVTDPIISGGFSARGGGDFDGDGVSDILIGDSLSNKSRSSDLTAPGVVYLVFGTTNRVQIYNSVFDTQNSGLLLTLEGAVNEQIGKSISFLKDCNGDGYADLLIGTENGLKTYVVFGGPRESLISKKLLQLKHVILYTENATRTSYYSVSSAGDCNGDSLTDILIGAPDASPSGQIYVVFGSAQWGFNQTNLTSLMDGKSGFMLKGNLSDTIGHLVSSAGDINGDQIDDIIVACRSGKVYIIFGSLNLDAWGEGTLDIDSLMDGTRGFLLQTDSSKIIGAISGTDDINGDSVSDIMIGMPDSHRTFIVFGSSNPSYWGFGKLLLDDFLDGKRGFFLNDNNLASNSGFAVTSADVNHDGLSDLIIGASEAKSGSSTAGTVTVVFGSRHISAWGDGNLTLNDFADGQRGYLLYVDPKLGDVNIGEFVSYAGDVNGDGVEDFLVSGHDGSQNSGVTYIVYGTAVPLVFVRNHLRIGATQSVLLTTDNLNVVTMEGAPSSTIRISVLASVNGFFSSKNARGERITQFSMQDIKEGTVYFTHDGDMLSPRYTLQAIADKFPARSITGNGQIQFLAYEPYLVNNKLVVNQGKTTLVQSSDLSASDQDNFPNELIFTISNISFGQFLILGDTNQLIVTNTFSQQDVSRGKIQFLHDGSANEPFYYVSVRDIKSSSITQEADIRFNFAPELTLSPAIWIDQGQNTNLLPLFINATDKETFSDDVIIEISDSSCGYFSYSSGSNLSIKAFKQFTVTAPGVHFAHDGSLCQPRFTMCAFDGVLRSACRTPEHIYLNHRPFPVGSVQNHVVKQGSRFNIVLDSVHFEDSDNETLSFRAHLKGFGSDLGAPLPPEIVFTALPLLKFSGTVFNVGILDIVVEASDPRGLTANISFILSIEALEEEYDFKNLASIISSIGGAWLSVAIFFWLRRRIRQHRRDFPFANDLRKTLNLEYYDFTRFEGDAFKTKVNDFLFRLQFAHQDFYNNLTRKEQKSFAVCVAEIVTLRGLVTRSGHAGGWFSIFCLLSVGWPSELNLRAFEVQTWDIVDVAVATWKQAELAERECNKPLKRWPYYSPSKKEKFQVCCCGARPSSSDRWFPDAGIALTELKQREAIENKNSSTECDTNSDLSKTVRTLKIENKAIREHVASMEMTIQSLSRRIDVYEFQPLLKQESSECNSEDSR